ncbi:hypothetical protein [Streptomyces cremeus]|uniref:Uncharacterized protein n=1 Tax=Streptomyces cremeus TaxID=66881 RepID=A0ABV5PDN1_STRCM
MAPNRTAALALSTSLCGALILGTAGAAAATTATDGRLPAASAPVRQAEPDLDALTEAVIDLAFASAADRTAARTRFEAELADTLADTASAVLTHDPESTSAGARLSLLRPADPDAGSTTAPAPEDTRTPSTAVDPGPSAAAAPTALEDGLKAFAKAVATGDWSAARQALGTVQHASIDLAAKVWSKTSAARSPE